MQEQSATGPAPSPSPLSDAIALLRCPTTGQRLVLKGAGADQYVSSEDGSVRYEIRDGLVLFVTGRSGGGQQAEMIEKP